MMLTAAYACPMMTDMSKPTPTAPMTDAHGRTFSAYREEARSMGLPPDGERVAVIGRLYAKATARRWVFAVRFQVAPGVVAEPSLDGGARFVAIERVFS